MDDITADAAFTKEMKMDFTVTVHSVSNTFRIILSGHINQCVGATENIYIRRTRFSETKGSTSCFNQEVTDGKLKDMS